MNPSTVSRVLRNDSGCYISADKKKKILDICKKYNYSPNVAARNLALGKTFNIAFVTREFRHFECFGPFIWGAVNGINEILNMAGYSCSVTAIKDLDDLKKLLFSGAYDGLIFGKSVIDNKLLPCLNETAVPYVFMNEDKDIAKGRNRIIVNERSGIEDGVKYLLSLGHDKIAVYGTEPHFETYKSIFHDHKLPFTDSNTFKIPASDIYNLSALSYVHSEIFIKKGMPFTAFCCTNDLVALGLSRRLTSNGIKIGTDVSVMGIDNWEQLLAYPESERFLTSVDFGLEEVGRESARLLLDMINDNAMKNIEREIDTKLVVRSSTGSVR